MRAKVREISRELGYQPDPMLAALAHYRGHRGERPVQSEVAWINSWSVPRRLRAFREFDLYWRGAADEASREGFRLTEFAFDQGMSAARLATIFKAHNIRGLLIPPCGNAKIDWTGFPWDAFSVVRFGHSVVIPRAHLVTSNQLHNGVLAYRRVREKGYRRIGLVISGQAMTRFAAGYLFAQMKTASDPALPPLQLALAGEAHDRGQLDAWLRDHRPDAILTDRQELPPMLKRLGVRVPDDVGLAAFSVLDGGVDAGIDQNSAEIGRSALRLLTSLILHQERGLPSICRELLIEGRWVDGASLPGR